MMTPGEETSFPYLKKNVIQVIVFKKQMIILQLQRCSVPENTGQGRETSLQEQGGFVREI